MTKPIWRRVNRWIMLGIAFASSLVTGGLGFIVYAAYCDLTQKPWEIYEWIVMPMLGLFFGIILLFMVTFVLLSLFEGITGWRFAYPWMKWLCYAPNAHLAPGEAPYPEGY